MKVPVSCCPIEDSSEANQERERPGEEIKDSEDQSGMCGNNNSLDCCPHM